MKFEDWARDQQLKETRDKHAERELLVEQKKKIAEWLTEIRWKITGPEENYEKWIHYCQTYDIIIVKSRDRQGRDLSSFHQWTSSRNLSQITIPHSDEILLVPSKFILKCLVMGQAPKE